MEVGTHDLWAHLSVFRGGRPVQSVFLNHMAGIKAGIGIPPPPHPPVVVGLHGDVYVMFHSVE